MHGGAEHEETNGFVCNVAGFYRAGNGRGN